MAVLTQRIRRGIPSPVFYNETLTQQHALRGIFLDSSTGTIIVAGSASGSSTASGVSGTQIVSAGTAAGSSAASAASLVSSAGIGTALGSSTAFANLLGFTTITGFASGSSTTAGSLMGFTSTTGTASGSSMAVSLAGTTNNAPLFVVTI